MKLTIVEIKDKLDELNSNLESNQSEQEELRSMERSLRAEIAKFERQLEEAEDAAWEEAQEE